MSALIKNQLIAADLECKRTCKELRKESSHLVLTAWGCQAFAPKNCQDEYKQQIAKFYAQHLYDLTKKGLFADTNIEFALFQDGQSFKEVF